MGEIKPPSRLRLGTLLAFLVPALYAAWLFSEALFSGKLLFGTDTLSLGLPQDVAARRAWALGQWPLWIPDLLGGMPGIASLNLNFLYPLHLISAFLGLPPHASYGWDGFLHVCLSAWGLILFMRSLGVSWGGAFLSGIFYALSGTQVSLLYAGHVNNLKAIALIPWCFFGLKRGIEGAAWGWSVLGLALGLQLLGGGMQIFAYTAPVMVAAAAWMAWSGCDTPEAFKQRGRRFSLGLPAAFALALLISAPMLLPSLEFKQHSWRASFSYADFTSWSFTPWESIQWLLPGLVGWKEPEYVGDWDFCLTTEYFGILPWVLAAAGAAALWRHKKGPARFFLALALAGFLVGLGKYFPLHHFFYRLPLYSGFRTWTRALCFTTFAVSVLAGLGWDALWSEGAERAKKWALGAAALALSVGVFGMLGAGTWAAKASAKPRIQQSQGGAENARKLVQKNTFESGAHAAALGLLALALVWGLKRFKAAAFALALAALFHTLDMRPMHARYLAFEDPARVYAKPAYVQALPDPLSGEPFRVYFQQGLMSPNQLEFWGYETDGGYHALPLDAPKRMREAMQNRLLEYLSLMGVRYLLMPQPLAVPTLVLKGQAGGAHIYENTRAFPRAFLMTQARPVKEAKEAWDLLAGANYDFSREAPVEGDPGFASSPGPAQAGVRWLSRTPLKLKLEAAPAKPSLLVLSSAWYPKWKAKVDGLEAPLLRAYGAFQSVALAPGRHEVELEYRDPRFTLSLWLALIGLLLAAAPWALSKRRPG